MVPIFFKEHFKIPFCFTPTFLWLYFFYNYTHACLFILVSFILDILNCTPFHMLSSYLQISPNIFISPNLHILQFPKNLSHFQWDCSGAHLNGHVGGRGKIALKQLFQFEKEGQYMKLMSQSYSLWSTSGTGFVRQNCQDPDRRTWIQSTSCNVVMLTYTAGKYSEAASAVAARHALQ